MTDALVKEYYSGQVRQKWRRLGKNAYYRLEFDTTLHFLDKYLPAHGLILDAGGGPGRYTLELAKKGYDVVLLDATQANLDFASRMIKRQRLQRKVKEITCGSIVFCDFLEVFTANQQHMLTHGDHPLFISPFLAREGEN